MTRLFRGNAVIGNLDVGALATQLSSLGRHVSVAVEGNNILGNGINCGVSLPSDEVADVSAINNYWGASAGPGPDPADDACNESSHALATTPFATQPFTIKPPLKP